MLRTALMILVLAIPGVAPAQGKTWIVDQQKGTGYHYTTVAAAVAKANHGDRIAVRSGNYAGFASSKGIAIFGQGSVTLTYGTISGLAAGRIAAISNIRFSVHVTLDKCVGRVVVDKVNLTGVDMTISDCGQVQVANSSMRSVRTLRAVVVMTECGFNQQTNTNGRTWQTVDTSSVGFVNCAVRGGILFTTGVAAFQLNNSTVTVTGDGSKLINTLSFAPSVFAGNGWVLLDPRVKITKHSSTRLAAKRVGLVRYALPYLKADGAPPGGIVKVKLSAASRAGFALAVAFPGPPITVPGVIGSLWLDPNNLVMVRVGNLDAAGTFALQVRAPKLPALVGLSVAWQAAVGTQNGPVVFSNPTAYVHEP